MIKDRFLPGDTAEPLGIEASEEFFFERQRSKSKEHKERFFNFENFQKTEKIQENES